MSQQPFELETLLQQLVDEHRRLLAQVNAQQDAMRRMDAAGIDQTTRLQDATRLRIVALDNRRKALTQHLARVLKLGAEPRLDQLAKAFPQHGASLLALRDELKMVAGEIAARTAIASRLATAVLGHLNTVVRCLAGASNNGGVYTKAGLPRVATRIGNVEAVG
jgi:hypothetical protein